jgi:hypothetical protein
MSEAAYCDEVLTLANVRQFPECQAFVRECYRRRYSVRRAYDALCRALRIEQYAP